LILARRGRDAYSEAIRSARPGAGFSAKGSIVLDDLLLFLGLLGFVCSIGMRWAARRNGPSEKDRAPPPCRGRRRP
jgi:hypothetical protein